VSDEKQDQPATQESAPAKGDPVEIPVPSREEFFGNLEQVSRPDDQGNGEKANKRDAGQNPDPSI